MFKRILVRREGSTCAEQGSLIAAHIARAAGDIVILLHEVPVSPRSRAHSQALKEQQGMVNRASPDMALLPHDAVQSQAPPGAPLPVASVPGPAVLTISDPAHAKESDLILLTAPGTASGERWMLQQVAQRAAPYPPVPLLVLREGETALSRSSLETASLLRPLTAAVALDGSRQAEAAILPAAHLVTALATPRKGALHLTRVVLRPSVDAFLQNQGRVDPQQRDQVMHEAMDYLCHMTDDLRASLEGKLPLTITWSISMDSDVANALIGVTEQSSVVGGTCVFGGCDFLALATHKRNEMGHWIPGKVTERLFVGTNLPLLFV